jgi:hypothetical protein
LPPDENRLPLEEI